MNPLIKNSLKTAAVVGVAAAGAHIVEVHQGRPSKNPLILTLQQGYNFVLPGWRARAIMRKNI